MAERAQEREGHATADDERVDAREKILDEGNLVPNLGAAEHGHQWPVGRFEDARQGRELALHEQPGRRRLQMASDGFDGGVGAMGGRKGVVHVAIGEAGQRARECIVVSLLLLVEAKVL